MYFRFNEASILLADEALYSGTLISQTQSIEIVLLCIYVYLCIVINIGEKGVKSVQIV